MKLFTIDKDGKFVQFKEQEFKEENKEVDLEILLENNPEYFFDNSKILIIGRQVTTNLNTFIDLLGVDQFGNTVVIELKRGKTPRETLAQLIEYASFIDNLDYDQLNEIYQDYSGEDANLEDYHQEYYKSDSTDKIRPELFFRIWMNQTLCFAGSNYFQHPGHIMPKVAHRLQSF